MRKTFALLALLPGACLAGPIQDNSFLIEEAYNQEEGVVQHINTWERARGSRDWSYAFTQEWPLGGIAHQLSYTLPVMRAAEAAGSRIGVGDVALNYRYQLLGDGDAPLAIAPRLTLTVPTGDEKRGRGLGATGYEAAIALSAVMGPKMVAHSNAAVTWTPRARDEAGNRADLKAWSVGQSVVWLASEKFNALVEGVYSREQSVSGAGSTRTEKSAFVSPGIRWAYDFDSGLQIVPGIAVPIGVGPSRRERSIFLYLSFEHPFRRRG